LCKTHKSTEPCATTSRTGVQSMQSEAIATKGHKRIPHQTNEMGISKNRFHKMTITKTSIRLFAPK